MIGSASCFLNSVSNIQINCTTGISVAGSYAVLVKSIFNGNSNANIMFLYNLIVTTISVNEGNLKKF